VTPQDSDAFAAAMKGNSCSRLGTVEEGDKITVSYGDTEVLQASLSELKKAWQNSLGGDS
jgi:hypothetical protein